MIMAEKIQEKNENFESIDGIVREVLSHEDVEKDNLIFLVSDSSSVSSSSVRITRIPIPA